MECYYMKPTKHLSGKLQKSSRTHTMDDLQVALFTLIVFLWICTQVPLIVSFLLLHVAIGIFLHEQQ